jgi:uracil-DNA glycosylase
MDTFPIIPGKIWKIKNFQVICICHTIGDELSDIEKKIIEKYPYANVEKYGKKVEHGNIEIFGNEKSKQKILVIYFDKKELSPDEAYEHLENVCEKIEKIHNLKSICFSEKTYPSRNMLRLPNISIICDKGSYIQNLSQIIDQKFDDNDWTEFLCHSSTEEILRKISTELNQQHREGYHIYPPMHKVFYAFELCEFKKLKVVIIGQDPYPQEGVATGLAFSVNTDKINSSLANIFKELKSCGYKIDIDTGNLEQWAKQGVLLINTALTVQHGSPGTHSKIWAHFTEELMKFIAYQCNNLAIVMWGKHAQSYAKYFDVEKGHKKFMSNHPCGMSCAGFFGTKPFLKVNEHLKSTNQKPIDWNLK